MGWHLKRIGELVLWGQAALATAASHSATGVESPREHLVTVQDSIAMTRLADPFYFAGGPSNGRVARFSPDGRHFAVVLEKGNLTQGTNDFSIYLFETAALPTAKSKLLLTMSSSSNRNGISQLQWLGDNETIVFLGENPGETGKVYSFNIRTNRLKTMAAATTAIVNYGITVDGRTLVYVAEPLTPAEDETEESMNQGIVITSQSLVDLLAGNCRQPPWWKYRLFVQAGGLVRNVPLEDGIYGLQASLAVSPDGRYAVVPAFVKGIPDAWEEYSDRSLHEAVRARPREGGVSLTLQRYLLLDIASGTATPLVNSPVGESPSEIVWESDGSAVILDSFLPLDISDVEEKERRRGRSFPVEVHVPDRTIRKLSREEWQRIVTGREGIRQKWEVTLREDANSPPRIYVRPKNSEDETLLLDLNPQFADIRFGRVETLTWKATDGHEVNGGLYLPPSYVPGKRYPLVIQTHGFNPDKFWIDGPWPSAYAAQALAAREMVVLQMGGATNHEEAREYYNTTREGSRVMAEIEGGIEFLNERGLIDRTRVGVVGFSRTVYGVGYTLTHSKYPFLAAVLVDGIDGGYFNHIVFGPYGDNELNGAAPYGEGLPLWLSRAPAFNLDKVRAAIRLVGLGRADVIGFWEWFTLLTEMHKPVDFVILPGAEHLIVRPSDRLAAQGGLVDWFCFWLKGEEDPSAMKKGQYERWHALQNRGQSNCAARRLQNNSTCPARLGAGTQLQ